MRIEVDFIVGFFLVGIALLTGIAAGLLPALRAGGPDLHSGLKESSRGSSSGVQHQRLRNALIVGEVALALVLLVGAGLLLKTVHHLQQIKPGFDPRNALTFRVELGWAAYSTEKTVTFHQEVVEKMRALPGVQSVTFDNNLPMSGKPRDPAAIRLFGQSPDEEARNPYINVHFVGPDYFRNMGIPLLVGRGFTEDDRMDAPQVAVASRTLAERLYSNGEALGARLQLANTAQRETWISIAGVSEPVLHHELDGTSGMDLYLPYTQWRTAGPYYVIRTAGDPMSIANAATAIIGRTDPNQSYLDVQTMEARVQNRIWQRRLAGAASATFAILALILAGVGLYGVLSYVVAQQTREIGVRVALGAQPRDVVTSVVFRGLLLAAGGTLIGLVLAVGLGRVLSGLLYNVSPADPTILGAAAMVLFAIACVACYVPARRAVRIDPIVALRSE
jgi:putative ABC transport system permease protein